ncbi:alpha/beta fold hydrolase [Antrihabitans sp. YC3-6]|uniref:Alpha/beta fold hydrolase n=1 Tax=Antrihabitans stalagmiti TaxID=2799499 RepID=A0A934NWJ4_9NOCA|nr:alpha/beta fold hydrolase [Antrihabitans stalagmiti]MBJ8342881.1 alpha/beta fold hydrolase [Antrihabitans stalagmiti]
MTIQLEQRTARTPDELAAPLDLLLTNSTRGIAGRMLPNRSWTRLGASLARQPKTVAGRGNLLARELGSIVAGRSDRCPARQDKRFSDPAWQQNPLLRRTMQAYLATAETADALFADAQLDWRDTEKMRFVLDNIIEGLSPTNNPLLSPLGWKAMIDTGGLSAVRGLKAFTRDMVSQPRVPAMVEPDAFAVGETVATTKGAVVLQTRVFELIHYAPRTEQVRATPLLMVPPVINKYYVMDIAPGRSMIEYFLQQGQQVFTISWRNPQARHRDWGFDTYGAAIIEALDAVRTITGTESAHLMASCSGGILAAMTAARLTAIGEGDRIAGLTLAVTVLDQNRAGFASAAMSERAAQLAIRESRAKGYLDGKAMAEVFAWLRPTDLVWRYWVNNYVQGRSPAAFDVLFWNADTTRMAAALHRDLVLSGLHNSLTVPGAVSMLGTPIDLSTITANTYVVAGVADHISPWQACYRSAKLLGSKDNRFVLSTSGHIAALVNPPGNPRASFHAGQVHGDTPDEWLATAEQSKDSWWPDYIAWLADRSGPEIDAPDSLGGAQFPPVCPAPGTYVHQH